MIKQETGLKLRRLFESDKEAFHKLFRNLNKDEQEEIARSWFFQARLNQLRPEGDWNILLWLCGVGFGKTRGLVEDLIDNAISNPGKRLCIVGRTASDVRDIVVNGESGIVNCAYRRGIEVLYEPSKRLLTFPGGSIAQTYTAEKPDQLRGPQFHDAYCDELAAWMYLDETWDNLMSRLRLDYNGQGNKVFIATTPRPVPLIKKLVKKDTVITISGTTYDNMGNLSSTYKDMISDMEGTRKGRQELYGELLLDTPGALWMWKDIHRVDRLPDDIIRTVVAVDPAVTNNPNSDETGICVASKDNKGNYYIIADHTLKGSPLEWGNAVVSAYKKYKADRIIYESNQGGDLVAQNIRVACRTVPLKSVHASKGKYSRAEPIAALYEQGKVFHVGEYRELEEQMTSYNPEYYKGSPDRLDAMVWAITELKGQGQMGFFFT